MQSCTIPRQIYRLAISLALLLLLSGCGAPAAPVATQPLPVATPTEVAAGDVDGHDHADDDYADDDHAHDATELPAVAPVTLAAGEKLQVVATTSIVADVVAKVGGETIELTTLMPFGADAHSYTAAPQDMRILNNAHVIFINGLHLEEALAPVFGNLDLPVPVVAVNAGVATLAFDDEHEGEDHADEAEGDDHQHVGEDPHTWQDVANVMIWVENIEHVLSDLDPANREKYAESAERYRSELEELDREIRQVLATVPAAKRQLVTDHDTLQYFAAAYDFEVVGAITPSFSTLASASAQELATLQRQMQEGAVQVIFVGTTTNPGLAKQLADDLGITVVTLYSDSLSEPQGVAATYVEMMRYNATAIANALVD
jgi:zinc/manganese transport system substrate-binding protein